MDCTERTKTAPTLDVFAPTSPRATARNPVNHKIQSERPGHRTAAANASTDAFTVFDGPMVDDQSPGSDPAEWEETEKQRFSILGMVNGFPSWLVSLCVHLALILVLAVSTFGVAGSRRLELEFAEAPAEFEIQTEIDLADITVEDEQELLEPNLSQIEIATDELVSLESMDEISGLIEEDVLTEIGDIKGVLGGPASEALSAAPSSSQTGDTGKSASFFGTESYGSKFVFVIDCSKSMKGNRWYRAVKELKSAIDGLENSQEFLVLLYNGGTYVMMEVPKDEAKLIRATESNKDLCRRWLRKQRPNGGTFPAKAMHRALELNPDAVFLLSDGELQDNTRNLLQTWNAEQVHEDGSYGKTPIHTISLGRKGQGQRMMRAIAHQNDGRFTWIQ